MKWRKLSLPGSRLTQYGSDDRRFRILKWDDESTYQLRRVYPEGPCVVIGRFSTLAAAQAAAEEVR